MRLRRLSVWLGLGLVACGAEPAPVATVPVSPVSPVSVPIATVGAVAAGAARQTLEAKLTPRKGADGEVAKVEVALALTGLDEQKPFALDMADEQDGGERGLPDAVQDLGATDDGGALPLTREKARIGDDDRVVWRAPRAPRGLVRVTYSVSVPKATPTAFENLRAVAGGLQGTASNLLVLPDDDRVFDVKMTWDLGELGPGASSASSLGTGPLSLRRVRDTVLMAGPIGHARFGEGAPLETAWLGKTMFDPRMAMEWASRARAFERAFFHDEDTAPFTVLLRGVDDLGPTWVGSGHEGGFLLLAGGTLPWDGKTRYAIAHELAHRWIGQRDTGLRLEVKEGTGYWFTEGFTVFLAAELMLRAGLASPEELVAEIDERAARLYRNSQQRATNDAIAAGFFQVRDLQTVPYDRGLLYALEVDAAMRARSSGSRSFDDLVLGLLERARARAREKNAGVATVPLALGDFRDAIRAELGDPGLARFDAVIERGELPEPPRDALGPCFEGTVHTVHAFVLGFEIGSFARKKVSGLVPGSAAARAGLRDGDVIVKGSVLDPQRPEKRAKVHIERDGKARFIEFSPAGAPAKGVLWERDPKVAGPCAITKKSG